MSSAYITPAGHKVLTEELKWLWKHKRPYATRKVKEAAALGDRSENADYHYNKRLLREIDRRIAYLSKRLDKIQIITRPPKDQARVFFGAWVGLSEGDMRNEYRIVGPDEIDFAPKYISIDAPVARALIGKRLGEEVQVSLGERHITQLITEIRYSHDGDDATLDTSALILRFQHFPMQL